MKILRKAKKTVFPQGITEISENVFTDEFATVYYSKLTEGWDSTYWKDYNLSVVDGNDDNEGDCCFRV